MKFYKGDIVRFSYRKRKLWEKLNNTFYEKPEIYMTSYIGQGKIKNCFKLEEGDIIKVLEYYGFQMVVEPINQKYPKDLYSISVSSIQNKAEFHLVTDKELTELKKSERKEKLKKLTQYEK